MFKSLTKYLSKKESGQNNKDKNVDTGLDTEDIKNEVNENVVEENMDLENNQNHNIEETEGCLDLKKNSESKNIIINASSYDEIEKMIKTFEEVKKDISLEEEKIFFQKFDKKQKLVKESDENYLNKRYYIDFNGNIQQTKISKISDLFFNIIKCSFFIFVIYIGIVFPYFISENKKENVELIKNNIIEIKNKISSEN